MCNYAFSERSRSCLKILCHVCISEEIIHSTMCLYAKVMICLKVAIISVTNWTDTTRGRNNHNHPYLSSKWLIKHVSHFWYFTLLIAFTFDDRLFVTITCALTHTLNRLVSGRVYWVDPGCLPALSMIAGRVWVCVCPPAGVWSRRVSRGDDWGCLCADLPPCVARSSRDPASSDGADLCKCSESD